VRFLRHLAAVVLTVAVIAGLGLLWAHASGGGTGLGGHAASSEALPRPGQGKPGAIRALPGVDYHPAGFHLSAFQLANSGILINTCEIEAGLAAVVITASVARRRYRRTRRSAATKA
jgi:hypothetical protein